MATIALPQGATKALATSKGKAYAGAGAVALVVAAYLLLSGGDAAPVKSTPANAPATTTATTTAPTAVTTTVAFAPSQRNPFTKGDGSQPASA